MSERLNDLVTRLAAVVTDRDLDGLEVEVGRGILLRRREATTSQALIPVRVASVGLALAMGVTAGSALATSLIMTPHPHGAFSASAHLAPSTLLEDGE